MSEHCKIVAVIRNPYAKNKTANENDPAIPVVEPSSLSLLHASAINSNITLQNNSNSRPSTTTIESSLLSVNNNNTSFSAEALASSCTATASTARGAATTAASSAASALVISATNKAGMDGIDRTRIDAIILRESGNSKFIQQQRKRDELVNEKIEKLRTRLRDKEKHHENNNTTGWKIKIHNQMEGEIAEILASRPVRSTCVVVDMDMFYMACELLSKPHLHDKPACVGNGMILTSNYTARKFGVRSAMAGWIGDKLVEELSHGKEKLIHVPSNYKLYQAKSDIVHRVLSEYDPNLRTMSLDEAYMDLGPYLVCKLTHPDYTHEQIRAALIQAANGDKDASATAKNEDMDASKQEQESRNDDNINESLEGKAEESSSSPRSIPIMSSRRDCLDFLATIPDSRCQAIAAKVLMDMRQRVCQATGGLTCSAGLAANFLLAKIASDINKPNGQCLVPSDHAAIVDFLHPLPIRKVSGIGRVMEKTLNAFGIMTVHDLYQQRALIRFLYENQQATTSFLLRACLGCGSSVGWVAAPDDEDAPSSSLSNVLTSPSRPSGQKSISRDRTFSGSSKSWTDLNVILEDLTRRVSKDMVEKGFYARTIAIKVKLDTFDVLCKSHSLARGVYSLQNAADMVSLATSLLRDVRKEYEELQNQTTTTTVPRRAFLVRLVGVRCSNFGEKTEETSNSSLVGKCQQKTMDKFLSSSTPGRLSMSPHVPDKQQPGAIPAVATAAAATMSDEPDDVVIDQMIREKKDTRHRQRLDATTSSSTEPVEATRIASAAATGVATTEATTFMMVKCPICQHQSFSIDDNQGLNRHVDSCLSGMVVREMIHQQQKEEEEESQQQPKARSRHPVHHNNDDNSSIKKKRRITDYW